MAESVLQLLQVQKIIKKQTIVDSVNMHVSKGQVLALCGGNGAGKSTILRMIAGILQPTQGTIHINGLQWKENRMRFAEQIGYMPDDYRFGQDLSAEETLSFWAALRGVSKERTLETLETIGLKEVRNKSVLSFSKGMRQRLLFAQAILSRPPLLVMDEPTNGLDPYWMESFVNLVQTIKQQGHAVVFSTHQLQVAEAVSDYVVFLQQGRIVQEGTTDNFRQKYGSLGLNAAFANLIGLRAEGQ